MDAERKSCTKCGTQLSGKFCGHCGAPAISDTIIHKIPIKKKRKHGLRNAGFTLIGIGSVIWIVPVGILLYSIRDFVVFRVLVTHLLGTSIGLLAAFVLGAGFISLGILFLILALIHRFIENENL